LAPALAYGATSITFGTPVRLPTFQSCGGYEPGIAIDRFSNIFVTAHKQNHCDAVALDPSAPAGVRAASWLWISSDGVNFSDLPGLTPVALDQLDIGDEGDIAPDDALHVYFVATKSKEDSVTACNPQGCTLPDSGWCRRAADHTAGSQHLYMFCDNDAGTNGVTGANPGDPGFTVGTLWSYVSADNGYTWKRYEVDRYNSDLPSGSNTN